MVRGLGLELALSSKSFGPPLVDLFHRCRAQCHIGHGIKAWLMEFAERELWWLKPCIWHLFSCLCLTEYTALRV